MNFSGKRPDQSAVDGDADQTGDDHPYEQSTQGEERKYRNKNRARMTFTVWWGEHPISGASSGQQLKGHNVKAEIEQRARSGK
jgi:hypothetical protein